MMDKRKQIEDFIAKEFNTEINFVRTRSRKSKYVIPKKVMAFILYWKEEVRMVDIAEYMGYKDHTTISHHIMSFEDMYKTSAYFKKKADVSIEFASEIYLSNKV
jgi:chromosomal replication initiation ATPase DnaA